jgi:membrane-associated phospholipid phosphatase
LATSTSSTWPGVIAFLALALVTQQSQGGRLARLDHVAMTTLRRHNRPRAAVTAARIISALAEPAVVAPLMTGVVLRTARRTGWRAGCLPLVAATAGAEARRILSRAVARPRPPASWWLAEPEGFSLPSKHATLAALAAGACARHAGASGPASHLIAVLAGAGVGASRVYLGVHWPSDILAACLFAEGWLHLADLPSAARLHQADY